jgi:hypothetical protein
MVFEKLMRRRRIATSSLLIAREKLMRPFDWSRSRVHAAFDPRHGSQKKDLQCELVL